MALIEAQIVVVEGHWDDRCLHMQRSPVRHHLSRLSRVQLLTAIAMFAALLAVLARTRVGLIIQAALTHPDMVAMLGHNGAEDLHAGVRCRRAGD